MTAQPTPRHTGSFFFALIIVIFSVVALWQAYKISGFAGLSTAGVFPMLAAGTMLIAAVFIIRDAAIKSLLGRQKTITAPETSHKILPIRLIVMIGLVALYIWVMPYVGFMIASAGFLFSTFPYLWRKKLVISVALTAMTLGAVYVVFRLLFQVVLPKGSLIQGLF